MPAYLTRPDIKTVFLLKMVILYVMSQYNIVLSTNPVHVSFSLVYHSSKTQFPLIYYVLHVA